MSDPYRTSDPLPLWSVTYSRPLFAHGPYRTVECTEIGVEARDEVEAIQKATKDVCSCEAFTVVDVHQMAVPKRSQGT
jgi:hypothetical protein